MLLMPLLTMVIGNLFALRQQNIKRFLAFSSIAQVGFILVGISGNSTEQFFGRVFCFDLCIFQPCRIWWWPGYFINKPEKKKLMTLKDCIKPIHLLSWVLALALFSLAGIPPTAGFFGKLFLLTAGAAKGNYWFIIVAALNMVVSLYYYLRVIRAIFMDKNEQPIEKIKLHPSTKFALIICGAGIVFTGLLSWIYDYIQTLG